MFVVVLTDEGQQLVGPRAVGPFDDYDAAQQSASAATLLVGKAQEKRSPGSNSTYVSAYTSLPSDASVAAKVVAFARAQIGDPYVFGAAGPSSYDCSGLAMAAYASAGVGLPHSAAAQYGYGVPVSTVGLVPGDLAFSYSGPGHVGIYVGNGMIIDSPHTGATVRYDPVGMYGEYVGARRIV